MTPKLEKMKLESVIKTQCNGSFIIHRSSSGVEIDAKFSRTVLGEIQHVFRSELLMRFLQVETIRTEPFR